MECRVWEHDRQVRDPVPGPLGRVRAEIRFLGWEWPRPEVLKTAGGQEMDLRDVPEGRLAHEAKAAAIHEYTHVYQAAFQEPSGPDPQDPGQQIRRNRLRNPGGIERTVETLCRV